MGGAGGAGGVGGVLATAGCLRGGAGGGVGTFACTVGTAFHLGGAPVTGSNNMPTLDDAGGSFGGGLAGKAGAGFMVALAPTLPDSAVLVL